LTEVDGVFHLVAQPGVRSFGDVFPLYVRHNVLASQRVFEAAARDDARVVLTTQERGLQEVSGGP
jgi:nucleoside-diphosphate-sugar epimerase